MEPGLHDISYYDYHADPAPSPSLSASLAKQMFARSPLFAWHNHPRLGMAQPDREGLPRSRATSAKRNILLGQAAHAVILEDSWDQIEVCHFDSFRKKDAIAQRDAALEAGRTPILEAEVGTVEGMKEALERNEWCSGILEGPREQSLVWQEGDVWCRCRLDVLRTLGGERAIVDFKTTELPPTGEGWGLRQIWEYELQVGLYRRGVATINDGELPPFWFVAQEVVPPFGAACFEFPPEAYEAADLLAEKAVRVWQQCISTDSWPGYPAGLIVPDYPFYRRERLEYLKIENAD